MARKFDDVVATTKKSAGKNTAEGLVLHHTGGGTYKSNLAYLSTNPAQASVHFVLGENGELGKIGDPADRLWHAGASERWGRDNCNNFLLGIEIVGIGQPNAKQLQVLTEFCRYLI
jgi:N-acetyl-anhydromuramyl-L-alanine amidase AmpD